MAVLVGQARAAAAAWVDERASEPNFGGAFFTGSSLGLPADQPLAPWSDVDVVVVTSSTAPPRPGKLDYRGAPLEVSYLPAVELADPARVAECYYLAPSFRSPAGIVADPTGQLRGLYDHIAPRFGDPAMTLARCDNVLARTQTRLLSLRDRDSWAQQVTTTLFSAGLTTHVVLVADRRNPTVRLRYRAGREVLQRHELKPVYRQLLELLGCADCSGESVQAHLDALATVFDTACAVARTPFPFSGDVTPRQRPVAIDASQALIDAGDHREAVFWIIATYARCLQILDADAPAQVRDDAERMFRAAVTDLLDLRSTADLHRRCAAVAALLPALRDCASRIAGSVQ